MRHKYHLLKGRGMYVPNPLSVSFRKIYSNLHNQRDGCLGLNVSWHWISLSVATSCRLVHDSKIRQVDKLTFIH